MSVPAKGPGKSTGFTLLAKKATQSKWTRIEIYIGFQQANQKSNDVLRYDTKSICDDRKIDNLGCEYVLSRFRCIQLFETLWTVAHRAPLSMGFSRQEYWSGLPCPAPGDLPDLNIKTAISYVSCIGRWVLYHYITTWEAQFGLYLNFKKIMLQTKPLRK